MNRVVLLGLFFLMPGYFIVAQSIQKSVEAIRIMDDKAPVIDGVLNDRCWDTGIFADNFIEYEPNNGGNPSFDTKVWFTYDDNALYVGAEMLDSSPDSIHTDLSQRDDVGNSDWFMLALSPSNDGQNGFKFIVTAAGVQSDIQIIKDNDYSSWDAVWHSDVSFTDSSWTLEIKIPWSAIRFPAREIHRWDVNMMREIRRYRQQSSWHFIDKSKDGRLSQTGKLTGINAITPPLRLSILPYASGYLNYYPQEKKPNYVMNYGADLRLGISESYTLDMTLIPDFGQVQSDDIIYNFSPFEVYYNEKRQFFNEGTELFNKAGIFYSRRIGDEPVDMLIPYQQLNQNDTLLENPIKTNLINATKISGRNKHGLAMGFFNAMTADSYAIIADSLGNERKVITQPFTNYNMIVLDKTIKNNSYLHFANTNVLRKNYSGNVSAGDIVLKNKKKSYETNLFGAVSQKFIPNKKTNTGHTYRAEVKKISDNIRWNIKHYVESDTYDPNDLGYLQRNNKSVYSGSVGYYRFTPIWKLLNFHSTISYYYNALYKPHSYVSNAANINTTATWNNYLSTGFSIDRMFGKQRDYYEAREWGRVFIQPGYSSISGWISPDYRKIFLIDFKVGVWATNDNKQGGYWMNLSPRWKISNSILITYRFDIDNDLSKKGYVKHITDDTIPVILFAKRDIQRMVNTINGNWYINSKAFVSLKARHYWIATWHKGFYQLNYDGSLDPYYYTDNEDFTVNIFNLDLMFTWNFSPGSYLTIAWKNALNSHNHQNIITNYFRNWDGMLNNGAANSFSVKLLYYIDYQSLKKTIF